MAQSFREPVTIYAKVYSGTHTFESTPISTYSDDTTEYINISIPVENEPNVYYVYLYGQSSSITWFDYFVANVNGIVDVTQVSDKVFKVSTFDSLDFSDLSNVDFTTSTDEYHKTDIAQFGSPEFLEVNAIYVQKTNDADVGNVGTFNPTTGYDLDYPGRVTESNVGHFNLEFKDNVTKFLIRYKRQTAFSIV